MSILSKLMKLIIKIVKKIVAMVVKFIKKYWWVILLVLAIWFAPAIGAFFMTNGFPALGAVFSSIGANVTPYLVTAGKWLGSSAMALGSKASTSFRALSLGTQLGIVTGAAAIIAPEETADLIGEIGSTTLDALGTVASAIGGSLFSSPWVLGAAAALGIWFFFGRQKETVYVETI